MEASSISNRSIVRDDLDDRNYETWSSCMEDYLLSQDLWDVVVEDEPETEEAQEIGKSSKNNRRKSNASALHAIKISCSPKFLALVVKIKSAKVAWDILAATAAGSANTEETFIEYKVEEPPAETVDNDKEQPEMEAKDNTEIDYDPFIKAGTQEDWRSLEEFIVRHPQAMTAKVFSKGRTLLHYLMKNGIGEVTSLLVNQMTPEDIEILDEDNCTALAIGACNWYPGLLQLLELMISKNPNLPNIGTPARLPVTLASWKGSKEIARFLYSVTDENILNPECGIHGASLLVECIESQIFDIATDLVRKFPMILFQEDCSEIYPIYTFAKIFCAFPSNSGLNKSTRLKQWWSNFREYTMKYVHHLPGQRYKTLKMSNYKELIGGQDDAYAFLKLVCSHVSTAGIDTLISAVYGAMAEAAKHGNIEFINEMLSANPELIWAHKDSETMFTIAIKNRRENVFNLIYGAMEHKDTLLISSTSDYNILHLTGMLAPPRVLDRTSGPALQVQTELQWFKEVRNVINPRHREALNSEKLTPAELFTDSHEKLIDAGEKSMKDTAQSSTVVGALIVTIMFAATFTVPGGNNQNTGYPLFVSDELFKIFIVCDALSLYSSATSVLIFLGILTSRYAEDDFLLVLPRKLILGISTLFFSIATMMVTFCAALAIMLNGRYQFILPIVLLAFVPVILFLSSIVPLLSKIYNSTFGPSIFDRNTKLPSKKKYKKEGENVINNPSSATIEPPNHNNDDEIVKNSLGGDQIV